MVNRNETPFTFLANDDDFQNMPFLDTLFGQIEGLIKKCVRENPNTDESRLRRLVSGNVSIDDLVELNGVFRRLPSEKKAPMTKWNALIQIESEESENFSFDDEHMAICSEKYVHLDNTPELLAKVQEKIDASKLKLAEKKSNAMLRPTAYARDLKLFMKNLQYFRANYNMHMIVVGICGDETKQLNYPPFQYMNSKIGQITVRKIQLATGKELTMMMNNSLVLHNYEKSKSQTTSIAKQGDDFFADGNTTDVREESPKEKQAKKINELLVKPRNKMSLKEARLLFRYTATKKWREFGQYGAVQWFKLFKEKSYSIEFNEWPTGYGPHFKGNTFDVDSYEKKDCFALIDMFEEKKICFQKRIK